MHETLGPSSGLLRLAERHHESELGSASFVGQLMFRADYGIGVMCETRQAEISVDIGYGSWIQGDSKHGR